MERPRWTLWLPTIFAVVVMSFIGATALGQLQMFAMDRPAVAIADGAAPGIEQLAVARGKVRDLQFLMREDLDRVARGEPSQPQSFEPSRRAVHRAVNDYLVLPVWPGEQALWGDVLRNTDALDRTVSRYIAEAAEGDTVAASSTLAVDFATIAHQLSDQFMEIIELNATHAHDLALEIRWLRHRAMYAAFSLDVVATLIAIAGALLLRHVVRAHAGLVEKHRELEERRASELEQFAGRVAHDILSPLGTVSLTLQLVGLPQEEERRRRILARGSAALDRVTRLVHGLLDFARAGAAPQAGVRTDVRAAMMDLAAELEPVADAAGVRLTVSDDGPCFAKCNAGVLTSLLSNPARNAIKYIGGGADRRIEIRCRHDASVVRFEVEDSGPGLPPDVADRAFEPYSRGHGEAAPGIGLGLATVKRLAETHGGRVGVRSSPGRGCTVWFELPNAESSNGREEADLVAQPVPT